MKNKTEGEDKPKKETAKERAERLKEEHDAWKAKTEKEMKKSPRTTLRKNIPTVLTAILDQAKSGSCQHAKVIFDVADVNSLPDAVEQKESESLTELLMRKLK